MTTLKGQNIFLRALEPEDLEFVHEHAPPGDNGDEPFQFKVYEGVPERCLAYSELGGNLTDIEC